MEYVALNETYHCSSCFSIIPDDEPIHTIETEDTEEAVCSTCFATQPISDTTCPECWGIGELAPLVVCPTCNGTGS